MISEFVEHSPGRLTVEIAKKYLGVRYAWGGMSPQTGFDCSGFVMYVFQESHDFTFQQRTAMHRDGVAVNREDLLPGDLVFFATQRRGRIDHLGIYIGDGHFIHSPRPGRSVMIVDMTTGPYKTWYHSARRVIL
jgi:cell wall-associated NlpC family hydrolase